MQKTGDTHSLHQIVTGDSTHVLDYSETVSNLKSALLGYLSEYKEELESRYYF